MYTRMDNSGVEDICYEQEHVEKVLAAIKQNFGQHFDRFLDSSGGKSISIESIQSFQKKLGIEVQKKRKNSRKRTPIRLKYLQRRKPAPSS